MRSRNATAGQAPSLIRTPVSHHAERRGNRIRIKIRIRAGAGICAKAPKTPRCRAAPQHRAAHRREHALLTHSQILNTLFSLSLTHSLVLVILSWSLCFSSGFEVALPHLLGPQPKGVVQHGYQNVFAGTRSISILFSQLLESHADAGAPLFGPVCVFRDTRVRHDFHIFIVLLFFL